MLGTSELHSVPLRDAGFGCLDNTHGLAWLRDSKVAWAALACASTATCPIRQSTCASPHLPVAASNTSTADLVLVPVPLAAISTGLWAAHLEQSKQASLPLCSVSAGLGEFS